MITFCKYYGTAHDASAPLKRKQLQHFFTMPVQSSLYVQWRNVAYRQHYSPLSLSVGPLQYKMAPWPCSNAALSAQSASSFSCAALWHLHFVEPETAASSGIARTKASEVKRHLATFTTREGFIPHQCLVLALRFLPVPLWHVHTGRQALPDHWPYIDDVITDVVLHWQSGRSHE